VTLCIRETSSGPAASCGQNQWSLTRYGKYQRCLKLQRSKLKRVQCAVHWLTFSGNGEKCDSIWRHYFSNRHSRIFCTYCSGSGDFVRPITITQIDCQLSSGTRSIVVVCNDRVPHGSDPGGIVNPSVPVACCHPESSIL